MTLAAVLDALTSKKGALLLAPGILLIGTTLAIGQNQAPAAAPETKMEASSPAAPAESKPAAPAEAKAAATEGGISPAQRLQIEAIVKDYLLKNPEVLMEAQNALEARMDKIQAERTAAAIKQNAREIFRPAGSPVVGNAKGDVTVIEFFDYNCPYCKKAFLEVAQLVEKDKQVKLILKEFPILSKGSEEAAKVALAAKLQGKYWEVHRALNEAQGQSNEASALRIAEKLGLDMAKLKQGHGLGRGEEGDRRDPGARHEARHPGHAALSGRRPRHPGRAREPARADRQERGGGAQGRLQGLLRPQEQNICG